MSFWLIWQQSALSIFPRVDLKKSIWIYFSQVDYYSIEIFLGSQDFFIRLYSNKNTLLSANSISVRVNWLMPKQHEIVSQLRMCTKIICACVQKISLHLWYLWCSILWLQNYLAFLTKSIDMKQNKEDQCLSEGLA